jgi:hypothetical protein
MNCEICKEKDYETKTLDNKGICKGCYDKVFRIIFKGVFTSTEAIKALSDHKEYHKFMTHYLTSWRKFSKSKKLSEEEVINTLKKEEQEYCVTTLKKYRNTITPEEHIKVMNAIITKYGIIKSKELLNTKSGTEYSTVKNIYLQGIRRVGE